jgi:hypothetical protein
MIRPVDGITAPTVLSDWLSPLMLVLRRIGERAGIFDVYGHYSARPAVTLEIEGFCTRAVRTQELFRCFVLEEPAAGLIHCFCSGDFGTRDASSRPRAFTPATVGLASAVVSSPR